MPALALLPQSDSCLFHLYFISHRKSQSYSKVHQGTILSREEAPQGQKLGYLTKDIVTYHTNELHFIRVIFLP